MPRLIGWFVNPIPGAFSTHGAIGLTDNEPQMVVTPSGEEISKQDFLASMSHSEFPILWTGKDLPMEDPEWYTNMMVNSITEEEDQVSLNEAWLSFLRGVGPTP